MSDYWSQKTVLVTGSSRGIGRGIALHLAKLGANVAIHYNSDKKSGLEVLEQCPPNKARLYQADVGDEGQVMAMLKQIEEDFGPIHVLINNAGQTKDGLLMTMPTEDWRALMRTHLDGTFYCTRGVLKNMLGQRFGRIINISSVSGLKGTPGQTNYSAVKAGIIGFTRALAREMGKKNITCNAIALGVIETEMTEVLSDQVKKDYKQQIALNRFGKVEEVAALVAFLAEGGSYITGQVITMDGGMV